MPAFCWAIASRLSPSKAMIQTDCCDSSQQGLADIGTVQKPTHADLDNSHIHLLLDKIHKQEQLQSQLSHPLQARVCRMLG